MRKAKLKLLIYSHEFPPCSGGAGRYSWAIARAFKELNHEVTVLAPRYSKHDHLSDQKEQFQILRQPKRILALFLMYYLKKLRPDHLLVTQAMAQQDCGFARFFFPFKYSVVVHGSEVLRYPQRVQPYKRLWRKAFKIIPVSKYTRQLLLDAAQIPAEKISIAPGGIDHDFFTRKGHFHNLRERLGISKQKVLLTLARIDPRKGQDMVIRCLPAVLKEFPDIKYIIAGTGNDQNRLKKIVEEYDLNRQVIFAGEIAEEQIIDYYDLCDIFVMPSRQEGNMVEGFGLSFLEANARGKPVIGGKHGGVPEAIVNGETGLLVKPTSTQEIADAIINLLRNEGLANRMGQKGKQRCLASYTWKHTAQKILNCIGEKT